MGFFVYNNKNHPLAGWWRGPDQALPATSSRVRVADDGPNGLGHGERQVNKEDQVRRGRGWRGQRRQQWCDGRRRGGVGRRLGFIIASESFQTEAALRFVCNLPLVLLGPPPTSSARVQPTAAGASSQLANTFFFSVGGRMYVWLTVCWQSINPSCPRLPSCFRTQVFVLQQPAKPV